MSISADTDKNRVSDIVKPVVDPQMPSKTFVIKGRMADKLAAILAATALGLSLLLSGLFFAGFVANDYHIFAITSALGLTVFLGAFAIVPMAIVLMLARKAYQNGGNLGLYLWVLFLVMPWLALSILCLIYTPLPSWMSSLAVLFALTLTIWGSISLVLEIKFKR
jgi:hypothetical protein